MYSLIISSVLLKVLATKHLSAPNIVLWILNLFKRLTWTTIFYQLNQIFIHLMWVEHYMGRHIWSLDSCLLIISTLTTLNISWIIYLFFSQQIAPPLFNNHTSHWLLLSLSLQNIAFTICVAVNYLKSLIMSLSFVCHS